LDNLTDLIPIAIYTLDYIVSYGFIKCYTVVQFDFKTCMPICMYVAHIMMGCFVFAVFLRTIRALVLWIQLSVMHGERSNIHRTWVGLCNNEKSMITIIQLIIIMITAPCRYVA